MQRYVIAFHLIYNNKYSRGLIRHIDVTSEQVLDQMSDVLDFVLTENEGRWQRRVETLDVTSNDKQSLFGLAKSLRKFDGFGCEFHIVSVAKVKDLG